MTGVYKIVTRDNLVYKYLNKNNEIGKLLNERLKHKNHLEYFNFQLVNGHKKDFIGKHIAVGYLFRSRGDYISPVIPGPLLIDIDIDLLDISNLIQFLFSLQELLINLFNYKKVFIKITGDWTLHNLIWNTRNGDIVNIDLEGFYTYSDHGPPLPWIKQENSWVYIKKTIKSLETQVIKNMISKLQKNDANMLSMIYLPSNCKIQWLFPYYLTSLNQNIAKYTFYIDLGELQGYKTQRFSVYIINDNQDKVSCLVKKDKDKNIPKKAKLLFNFNACLEKGHEHPIPVSIITKKNPLRSVLNIDKETSQNIFYIKKFYR